MDENILNKRSDEIAGDHPEMPVDRVKMIVSEATVSSHTDTERSAVIDRTVERRVEPSATDLKLHAMNYAMNNTFVIERSFDDAKPAEYAAKPAEYAAAMIAMAEQYLEWLKA